MTTVLSNRGTQVQRFSYSSEDVTYCVRGPGGTQKADFYTLKIPLFLVKRVGNVVVKEI